MSICNMSIEAGARAGLIALMRSLSSTSRVVPSLPRTVRAGEQALSYWKSLPSDEVLSTTLSSRSPLRIFLPRYLGYFASGRRCYHRHRPRPKNAKNEAEAKAWERALEYMVSRPTLPWRRSRLTRSSSARAPTPVSKISAPLLVFFTAAKLPRDSTACLSPVPVSSRSRLRPRVSTRSSKPLGSTGVRPVAPCVSV